ncbi:MAG TPA: hypothetical protein VF710_10345 [Longimicrobium sp.]|jgi:hypothetical protein
MKNTSGPLIHLEGLFKVFLAEEVATYARSNIDLEIARGEFVAIAGPSRYAGYAKRTVRLFDGKIADDMHVGARTFTASSNVEVAA